jgi:hypothetical protein
MFGSIISMMFGAIGKDVIAAMKEVMTEDEVKNFSSLSDERKNEILQKVQEIVEKKTTE